MDRFDWTEYLDLAEEFALRRGDPAAERGASSRAYYAVFHQASDVLLRHGERLPLTGDDHVLVGDWFLRLGADTRSQRIGATGQWLRRARRRADYEPSPLRHLSREAQTAVQLARRLLADLAALT